MNSRYSILLPDKLRIFSYFRESRPESLVSSLFFSKRLSSLVKWLMFSIFYIGHNLLRLRFQKDLRHSDFYWFRVQIFYLRSCFMRVAPSVMVKLSVLTKIWACYNWELGISVWGRSQANWFVLGSGWTGLIYRLAADLSRWLLSLWYPLSRAVASQNFNIYKLDGTKEEKTCRKSLWKPCTADRKLPTICRCGQLKAR